MSDKPEQHVLKLDELFGIARPIKVEWQGSTYDLMRPEAFTPVQYQKFVSLYNTFVNGRFDEKTDLAVLDGIMDQIFDIINPQLLMIGLTFTMKAKVLEFYGTEINGRGMQSKPSKKSIGARRTH